MSGSTRRLWSELNQDGVRLNQPRTVRTEADRVIAD